MGSFLSSRQASVRSPRPGRTNTRCPFVLHEALESRRLLSGNLYQFHSVDFQSTGVNPNDCQTCLIQGFFGNCSGGLPNGMCDAGETNATCPIDCP